ncbi:acyl-ACP--UDP-N-acetylglucosamine O-acyltransferase [Bradyrhizobium sp. LHD-71]|uniref:acyl-ACP--UDP-N-acetylglucosamine O-acyltransferase n=1 Tax=Bradyrhizobium sp. LHD-71 TaxID=3072141 RepID=UPI00280D48FC|nr:acyl-ACP--UDP-N-acetylglucosamine O-acyltransferase [Bradyrhizobium sp. LHD-71]MDQ8728771.1 acyl-ACP--UDP-N-acetylglucosamine O-acyltransferase [Bradyrhizobium sp. LHD-71]
MATIDPTARIEDGARVAADAEIGPFCIVGKDVTIGSGCRLLSHVNVTGRTTIGAGSLIYPFASLGTAPQSLAYRGEPTMLEIGENCTIRESVTMNVGTVSGGGVTRVGRRGYFMSYSHVGHDCRVGDDVIFANSATLGGHCDVGDNVFIGGLSAVHQFGRVGSNSMIGGVTGVRGDVIPFGLANGQYAFLDGLNIVGMRRRKFTRERLHKVRSFYQELFHGGGAFADRLAALQDERESDPAIAEILDFLGQDGKRSLVLPKQSSGRASLEA